MLDMQKKYRECRRLVKVLDEWPDFKFKFVPMHLIGSAQTKRMDIKLGVVGWLINSFQSTDLVALLKQVVSGI
ncbi:MAG: hypothetical protein H7839_17370 [Magnetococcus sp. YQC-5]